MFLKKIICFLALVFPLKLFAVISASAYLTSSLTNCTGNGPLVYIPFNAVTFDDASSFNLSNGSYICSETGTLIINGIVEVSEIASSHTTLAVVVINQTTSEQRYVLCVNPYPILDGVPPHGYYQSSFATTMKCTEGDVFYLVVFVLGGTQTVTINGGQMETRMSYNLFSD
jgi:hypothetical protein